jgi:hypothetical protein
LSKSGRKYFKDNHSLFFNLFICNSLMVTLQHFANADPDGCLPDGLNDAQDAAARAAQM